MKTQIKEVFLGRGLRQAAFVPVALLAAAVPAYANAIITWGGGPILADSDVSTAGTLVGAFRLGNIGVANTTVNGVTFSGLAITSNSVTSGNFNLAGPLGVANGTYAAGPFGFPYAISASYGNLLSTAVFTFGVPFTLTMSNLVPGTSYQFQWWSNDNFGSGTNTVATAGNSINLVSTLGPFGPLQWLPGQFATGTFVADATTVETITYSSGFFSEVNAFQLRQISSVPDTTSAVALFGLSTLTIFGIYRRMNRSATRT